MTLGGVQEVCFLEERCEKKKQTLHLRGSGDPRSRYICVACALSGYMIITGSYILIKVHGSGHSARGRITC